MNNKFQELSHNYLSSKTLIKGSIHDSDQKISLNDAATMIMTDFNHIRPFTISSTATIDEINHNMIACGVRLLFVTDANEVLQGLVTYNDIFGIKPVLYIQANGGQREEITTRNIMTPLHQLEALQLSEVAKARVGNILETIQNSGRQHLLVVEGQVNGEQTIKGLFSSTQMEKQLGIRVEISSRAKTFSDLERALTN